ncbi:hypothetical protein H4582DRAFT_2060428 [Lactarius indigo]|nr:hypothetical protein H4582DRAFT_2060428 [Lactarius indigo]
MAVRHSHRKTQRVLPLPYLYAVWTSLASTGVIPTPGSQSESLMPPNQDCPTLFIEPAWWGAAAGYSNTDPDSPAQIGFRSYRRNLKKPLISAALTRTSGRNGETAGRHTAICLKRSRNQRDDSASQTLRHGRLGASELTYLNVATP